MCACPLRSTHFPVLTQTTRPTSITRKKERRKIYKIYIRHRGLPGTPSRSSYRDPYTFQVKHVLLYRTGCSAIPPTTQQAYLIQQRDRGKPETIVDDHNSFYFDNIVQTPPLLRRERCLLVSPFCGGTPPKCPLWQQR